MLLSRNKKNKVYPCKPQFYYIKVGFKGVKIIKACLHDAVMLMIIARCTKVMLVKKGWFA